MKKKIYILLVMHDINRLILCMKVCAVSMSFVHMLLSPLISLIKYRNPFTKPISMITAMRVTPTDTPTATATVDIMTLLGLWVEGSFSLDNVLLVVVVSLSVVVSTGIGCVEN